MGQNKLGHGVDLLCRLPFYEMKYLVFIALISQTISKQVAFGRPQWIQEDFVRVKTQMGLDRFEVDFFLYRFLNF